ncbi:hypothetical protein G7B40_040460 [Aetokthonos hydrillicola Thurmond2011]|jgi:hypothetical protein|uniref:Uncharacterized protein n=1 Tax=Aetokthonos hydrillicola Thurmond2011 TaxID=2712845 RepID=A0AAP5IHI3_9CYAN|nr:hypothetical protein [Aetokthonos hydrillicola]MBO3463963.1 hypothetical protein [Aetokthonos hydrillicola CCALA 1050]MDR9900762.1 hypothetical protein [Aetokthonos hydrillicola Thurmond2011]
MYKLTDGINYIFTSLGWEYVFQGHTYGDVRIFLSAREASEVLKQNLLPASKSKYGGFVSQVN